MLLVGRWCKSQTRVEPNEAPVERNCKLGILEVPTVHNCKLGILEAPIERRLICPKRHLYRMQVGDEFGTSANPTN